MFEQTQSCKGDHVAFLYTAASSIRDAHTSNVTTVYRAQANRVENDKANHREAAFGSWRPGAAAKNIEEQEIKRLEFRKKNANAQCLHDADAGGDPAMRLASR